MTQSSPAQWRVLNTLFISSLHTVRPWLTAVSKSQDIEIAEIDALFEARLITAYIGNEEFNKYVALHRCGAAVQKKTRLRLTARGKAAVMDTPRNQILYSLGQLDGTATLVQLYSGNTLTIDHVADAQRGKLITVTLADSDDFELTADVRAVFSLTGVLKDKDLGGQLTVTLTAKGREYLPR